MQPERVIRGRRVEDDAWVVVGFAPHEDLAAKLPEGAVIVPLSAWTARRDEIVARGGLLGVWLAPADDPEQIAADLDRFSVIAVHFPKFTDGRGYSTAALLRTRYAYRGELRAFGDVGRDQLFNLARCGFDSFKLAAHHDPESAIAAFADFSVRYQGSVDDPVPLFRKRAVAGAVAR